MRYKPSRYMLQRRRSAVGSIARGLLWLAAAGLLLVGVIMVFAAPLAEMVLARALNARGLGPVSVDVTRIDPAGLGLRRLSLLDGAARLDALDVTYDWRTVTQGRVDAVRIEGLDAKITWGQDGVVRLGPIQLRPRPSAESATASTPERTERAQTAPPVRALTIENSKLTLALPNGDITLPVSVTAAQDENGRALDFRLEGRGPGIDLTAVLSAQEPTGKIAQGEASISAQVNALSLPGLVSDLSGEIRLNLDFDANGARTKDTRVNLSFDPPSFLASAMPGLAKDQPLRITLGATNSRLFIFSLDRTLPIPRALIDGALMLANGRSEVSVQAKGWADVPLANNSGARSDPQDFNVERLSLSTSRVPVRGGTLDASLAIQDLRGPIAVAEGRVSGAFGGNIAEADRFAGAVNSGFRLDGLSLSFDLQDLWLEAENLRLGSALAQGVNRAELSTQVKTAQQINVVFSSAGGTTLTADVGLSASLPKVITTAADPQSAVASLALPRLILNGYLTQAGDDVKGQMKLAASEGRLAHPLAGLADLTAELGFNGKILAGPVSARLWEAADPSRPRGLDRRGATLNSDLMIDSDSIDIKGKISAGPDDIGTFSYSQAGPKPGTVRLKIPPRTWSEAPSFLEAFGPLAALTATKGTFGLDLSASPAAKDVVAGSASLALADFGFTAGALSMQSLNAALELDQIWPPRAKAPQRVSFARMLAGVPFTDGDFTLALPGDGTVVMNRADVKLAGGAVTGRDLVIPLDQRDQTFVMDVTNVDMSGLVAAFATDGLAATGKLSGKLPLRLKDGVLFIERGRLGGRNGNIRYAPATPPAALAQGGGTILLQALADFKYDEVTANLNGDITKDLAVGLTLKGRNPGLYGGYPIEFNLNLDGPLNRLVREGLSGYRIPDDIKQRLEQMGVTNAQ